MNWKLKKVRCGVVVGAYVYVYVCVKHGCHKKENRFIEMSSFNTFADVAQNNAIGNVCKINPDDFDSLNFFLLIFWIVDFLVCEHCQSVNGTHFLIIIFA